MDVRRMISVQIQVLEEFSKALQEMTEDDLKKVITGDLKPSISFVRSRSSTRRLKQGKLFVPMSEESLKVVHDRLNSATSQEEGQTIVEKQFDVKEGLYLFAKYLKLPVQRRDTVAK